MSNRNWASSRVFNQHMLLRQIDGIIQIGSSGAPTINTGDAPGINSITRLSAGRYRIQLQDNYAKLIKFSASSRAPVTGSSIPVDASDASLSVGTVYQILTLGTSTTADWVALGLPAGITPTVGCNFKAAATGSGTGSGTVKAIGNSGIAAFEQLNATTAMLSNQPFTPPSGGYVDFQCLGPVVTMASYTPAGVITNGTPDTFAGTPAVLTGTVTYTPTDPASGSSIHLVMIFNDSRVQ